MARKMKDSGIEWIGQIPEDWEVSKLKYVCNIESGEYVAKEDYLLDGKYDIIGSNGKIGTINKINVREEVITTGRVGSIGTSHIVKNVWVTDNTLVLYKKNNVCIRFLAYIVPLFQYELISTGTAQPLITATTLKNQYIPFVKLEEQQKIACFLDDKVGEIDAIILKTKESIEEYKKYKQAVITEAITLGLNKSVTIIDTGNVHIPKVPAHWKMKKIKYIFEIKKDIAGKEGYDILSITQKGIKVKDISKNEGQLAQDYSNYQLVDIGDFAMNHMDLLTGWVDISKYAGVTSPDYRVFRFIDKTGYDADYYLYLMQMCYMNKIFYGLGQGVSNLGRWRLQADKFLNFSIPEPPLAEQQEIAKYLSARCGEIDALIAKKEAFVEEMENYKKSLIYEYVTGKKEVM